MSVMRFNDVCRHEGGPKGFCCCWAACEKRAYAILSSASVHAKTLGSKQQLLERRRAGLQALDAHIHIRPCEAMRSSLYRTALKRHSEPFIVPTSKLPEIVPKVGDAQRA